MEYTHRNRVMNNNYLLMIITFFLFSGCFRYNMENFDNFAFIVFIEDITNLASSSFSIKTKGRYMVQIRLDRNSDMRIGDTIFNTYYIYNDKEIPIFDLLSSMILVFKDRNGENYLINKGNIVTENTSYSNLYGKITVREKYIFITLASIDMKRSKYFFVNYELNDVLLEYNPKIIIGVGQSGTF